MPEEKQRLILSSHILRRTARKKRLEIEHLLRRERHSAASIGTNFNDYTELAQIQTALDNMGVPQWARHAHVQRVGLFKRVNGKRTPATYVVEVTS